MTHRVGTEEVGGNGVDLQSRKHAADEEHGDQPPKKRIHSSSGDEKDKRQAGDALPSLPLTVTEADVGIVAYVNAGLAPIEGGIIKQRYSDFHVREVAKDGQVCHITSLLPPPKEQGGSGLFERMTNKEVTPPPEKAEQASLASDSKQDQKKQWNMDEVQTSKLIELLGTDGLPALQDLWTADTKRRHSLSVQSLPLSSKEERTKAHQLIRELFGGLLATETVPFEPASDDGTKLSGLQIRWGKGRQEQRRSAGQSEKAKEGRDEPPYIHFLMQKTNRDGQDALNILARSLGLLRSGGGGRGGGGSRSVKEISVAGTKDKRGVTVQQIALKRGRKTLDDVWRMANGINKHGHRQRTPAAAIATRADRGVRVAHLRYSHLPLRLGQSRGNEFEIVLRNVKVQSRDMVDQLIEVLRTKGFINYFGMQRFGTSQISTHKVGISLLAEDYRKAIEIIMATRESDAEEVQEARKAYEEGRLDDSLRLFPHFYVPERSIIQRMRGDRHLFTQNQKPSTVQGAPWKQYFSALPRILRTMYVHAYQSYVWNTIASERVRRHGLTKPVIGDWVLLSGDCDNDEDLDVDENDADLDDEDARANGTMPKDGRRKQVKILESDADVDLYTIHDVVLPMPGHDVHFAPSSWMMSSYVDLLKQDGLTPQDLERSGAQSAELVLSGDYRALLHLPRNVEYELVRYADPNVNLLQSDEEKILGFDVPPAPIAFERDDGEHPFVALVLRLTLGTSAYATMALREILKQETSSAHQRGLTMKGEDRLKDGTDAGNV